MSEPAELAEKLAFLRRPESWGASAIEVVQTHLAYVFLVGDEAFKLKRPVRYHDVDYTGLRARQTACEREVALNRRFALDVYRGVVPLRTRAGHFGFGDDGSIVDWLVRMRRLPAERMLDRCLAHGRVDDTEAQRLGAWLADRYSRLVPAERDVDAHLARLHRVTAGDLAVLRAHGDGVAESALDRIDDAQAAFLSRHRDLVANRVRTGRIVEGHGDLRPEHICLEHTPSVIDCLEWDGDLRIVDCAADIVFLALECARMGAATIGDAVLAAYEERAADRPEPPLLAFYRSQQATARAKVAVWHLADPGPSGADKWIGRARDYLRIAERACASLQ